jgi:hypothetical protein
MTDTESGARLNAIVIGFVTIVTAFSLWFGMVGFGVGTFFWDVWKGIGLGVLMTGAGSLFGVFFGGKKIMRSVIAALPNTLNDAEQPRQ